MDAKSLKDAGSGIYDVAGRITSRQNPTVSEASALSDAKKRREAGLFLADGIKLTLEALSSGLDVRRILLTERAAEKYGGAIMKSRRGADVYILSDAAFDRVTDEKAPEGIVSVIAFSDTVSRQYSPSDAEDAAGRLILDGVQNPENLGAILRSARAFGQRGVICGDGCADVYGRRVMRSSMGAALHAGVLRTHSLADVCRELAGNGHRVIAAVPRPDAVPIQEFSPREGDCVIIGNEGHGISEAVAAEATDAVFIPMEPGQESLNAAAAAAVILWEFYKALK